MHVIRPKAAAPGRSNRRLKPIKNKSGQRSRPGQAFDGSGFHCVRGTDSHMFWWICVPRTSPAGSGKKCWTTPALR